VRGKKDWDAKEIVIPFQGGTIVIFDLPTAALRFALG
jgi:hypothetical protein